MEPAPVIPQLFGIIPTGSPIIITPSTIPSPTSFTYNIPLPQSPGKPFTHLTVFLLPGIALPPSTAAAVYIAFPQAPVTFKFLGAIGANKESAVFKISGLNENAAGAGNNSNLIASPFESIAEVDMDTPDEAPGIAEIVNSPTGEIVIGITIESAESVSAQMEALRTTVAAKPITSSVTTDIQSQPLIAMKQSQPDILLLAQRIIKDAFNFLSSYGSGGAGEMVPLKVFEEWWRKFESKVKRDPSFLEVVDMG